MHDSIFMTERAPITTPKAAGGDGREKVNNFDALRLAGALLVLVSHQFALAGRPEPFAFATTGGTLGVLIFFSISGFLVASSWKRDPHVGRFAMRRALRIWPGLVAVVVLTAGPFLLLDPRPEAKTAALRYLGNVCFRVFNSPVLFPKLFDSSVFFPDNPHGDLNGSLWTLPLELLCYGALVLFALVLGRHTRLGLLVVSLVVVPSFMLLRGPALLSGAVPAGLNFLPYFGAYFAVGALLAHIWPPLRARVALIGLGALALGFGLTALGLTLIIPVLVLSIGVESWSVLREAGRFGDLSYGTYIWAWPVQQVGVKLLGVRAPYLSLLAVTLIATGLLAWLSWHLVERPALRLKPSKKAVIVGAH